MPDADQFRTELHKQLDHAQKAYRPHIEIKSGELHRDVGGYPSKSHQMPTCCAVMESEMQPGDEILAAPPSGRGASLIIRYKLPR